MGSTASKIKRRTKDEIDPDDTIDQAAKQLASKGVARRLSLQSGFAPRHPVAMFNSICGCVLEVKESSTRPQWEGEALWVDIGKVAGVAAKNMATAGRRRTRKKQEKEWRDELKGVMDTNKDGNISSEDIASFCLNSDLLKGDPIVKRVMKSRAGKSASAVLMELDEVKSKLLAALLDRRPSDLHRSQRQVQAIQHEGSTDFTKHMQLHNGWQDPEGIKVRPKSGIAAMECIVANDPGGIASKLGAGLMLSITSQLKTIGYEEGVNLRGYGFDWRTPCTKLEERDGYFSGLMDDMEDLMKANGGKEKIVVVSHSLGGVCAHYFFQWVRHSDHGRSKGGVKWLEHHIHAFLPIGGPLLGAPMCSSSFLYGDDGYGLSPAVVSAADRHIMIRSWGMFSMAFPTGLHLRMQPTHAVHWVRREGVLKVHVLQVEIADESEGINENDESITSVEEDESSNDTEENNPSRQSRRKYCVNVAFQPPGNAKKQDFDTSPQKMRQHGAFDEHFQFVWSSTPTEIDGAELTMKLCRGLKYVAMGSFDLRSSTSSLELEGTAHGLLPNTWTSRRKLTLYSTDDKSEVVVTIRLRFQPFSENELCNDFSRTPEADPGAWRCGGPADDCSTEDKRKIMIKALGSSLGSEWRPSVKRRVLSHHRDATYAPMRIDQMMVLDEMEHEYNWWKECFADDPIWRNHSSKAPIGVRRVRPIYGINLPTMIGNVMRQKSMRYERNRPTTTLKADKHCEVSHAGYSTNKGEVFETKNTPQADDPTAPLESMTFDTRASGDATVPYWSLRWPIAWRGDGIEVDPVEVEGADHRGILDTNECLEAVLSECCSHPSDFVEIRLDGLILSDEIPATVFASNGISVELIWRGAVLTTEAVKVENCSAHDKDNKLWSKRRFVLGVTADDLDVNREIEIHINAPILAGGTMSKRSNIKIGLLIGDDAPKLISFHEGKLKLRWSLRWGSADTHGMPDFTAVNNLRL